MLVSKYCIETIGFNPYLLSVLESMLGGYKNSCISGFWVASFISPAQLLLLAFIN